MKNFKKYLGIIEYILIAFTFIFILFMQKSHVMWLDELDWGIGILLENNNLKDIYVAVLKTGENLPLFYFTIYIVKILFGYNEFLLILESTIIAFIGILGIIKITRKYFNRYIEFFSVFLICISYLFIAQCCLQVRPYSLLFCFSAWTLYFYLERLSCESWKNIIKYGVCMIFLMYTHWFGILISLCYAFIDFVLFLKKKVYFKCIVSYLIGGLAFLPCFILLLIYHNGDIKEFGVDFPNFLTVYNILLSLVNYLDINIIIMIVSFIFIIVGILRKKENYNFIGIISSSAFILIFGVILFSFINPKGSLLRNRYFVTILPHIVILLSWFMYKVAKKFKSKVFYCIFSIFLIYYILFIFCCGLYLIYYNPNVAGKCLYEGNAKYFSEHEDCYDDKTLIICPYGRTWVKYYFENNGIKLPKNIIVQDPLKFPNTLDKSEVNLKDFEYCVKDGKIVQGEKITDILQYDTIYYFEEYRVLSEDLKKELSENYEENLFIEQLNLKKLIKK